MTAHEALIQMSALLDRQKHRSDWEADHRDGDLILIERLKTLGETELVEIWERLHKWYA